MTEYLALRLSAYSANLQANSYVYGLPGMGAFAGFAHALERRINAMAPDTEAEAIGIAPFFIEVKPKQGTPRYEHQRHAERSKARAMVNAASLGESLGNLRVALIIEIDSEQGLTPLLADGRLHGAVCAMRLAGGTIFAGPNALSVHSEFASALARVPPASFALEDCTNELIDEALPGEDQLDTLERLVLASRMPAEHAGDAPYRGLRVPLGIGYVALEPEPCERELARQGYPHVYAEPVVGLARARLAASLRAGIARAADPEESEALINRCLWQHVAFDNDTLLIRSLYHGQAIEAANA